MIPPEVNFSNCECDSTLWYYVTNIEHKVPGSNVAFILHEKAKLYPLTKILNARHTICSEHLGKVEGRQGGVGGRGGREEERKGKERKELYVRS